jgi:hypothetical protein
MPPFLRAGKLGLYLAAWLPIAYALAILLGGPGRIPWPWNAAAAVPLCLIYAFICLCAWYPCRALPPRAGRLSRIVVAHLMAASMASGLWLATAVAIFAALPVATRAVRAAMPEVYAMGIVVYLLAVAVNYALLAFEDSQEAQAREGQARLLAGEAELRALKAQINPHFLYNCLNSISALTTIDPAKAREMCVLLSEFLRSTLGLSEKSSISLAEDLALVRGYLAIERIRFGSRLEVHEELQGPWENYPVPALLLQPLVENAVVHGIANLIEPGYIKIHAGPIGEGGVLLAVENSFDSEAQPSKRRGGFGLAAARKRLDAHYNGRARLDTIVQDGTFRVEIRLPKEEDAIE